MENHYVGTSENPNSFDEGIELIEHIIKAFDPNIKRTLKQFHNDPNVNYVYNYYLKGIISNWEICRKWLKNPQFKPDYEEYFMSISLSNAHLRKKRIDEVFSGKSKEREREESLKKLEILSNKDKLREVLNSEIIYNLHQELDKICPLGDKFAEQPGYFLIREIDSGWNYYSKKLILKQKHKEYKEYVDNHFQQFKDDYKNGFLNIHLVFKIGAYIAAIQCGFSDAENNLYNHQYMINLPPEMWNSMYPLMNNTGIFAINTYLYGFFNKVFLIGIPSEVTLADSFYLCPNDLLDHDIGHMHNFDNNDTLKTIEKNKDMYYEILNRKYYPTNDKRKVTTKEKEVMLLMLWWVIHEGTEIEFSYFKRESTFNKFYENYTFGSFPNLEVDWLEYYDVMAEIIDNYRRKMKTSFSGKFGISSNVFESYEEMKANSGKKLNLTCSKMALWYLLYNIYHFDSNF